jgi:hypothetical protein
VRSNSGLRCF